MTEHENNGTEVITEAAELVESSTDAPMSLAEFIEEVLDEPEIACSAPKYLLRAIEHFGTRTVTEHGEDIERYRFFDDPANDGEHAILGNTELLNSFVEDVRQMAEGPSDNAKMFWFEGPTATGKSELKRCLINGLNAFSKTDEGRRYTIEWNARGGDDNASNLTYGDGSPNKDRYWYQSPVQANPLSVLPYETRRQILHGDEAEPSDWVPPELDPFSQEAYDIIQKEHDGDFESVVSDDHLRVVRYNLDIGTGIGVLQSEDSGPGDQPRHKLVGRWMSGMIKELDSRGRRNPQALAYDGVLSQGNNGLSIIEDAAHHFDTIYKMLSVPEDDAVKIDQRNKLPIDTVPIIISNPDMKAELEKTMETPEDQYRPLRRRLNRYSINYLVTPSLEAELLYRLLTGYERVWDDGRERMKQSVTINDVELAPHALEAVALYDVVSRFKTPDELTSTQKARVYDGEKVEINGTTYDVEHFEEYSDGHEGRDGIPCTFTYDVIEDAVSEARDNDMDVIMPSELTATIANSLRNSPVFSEQEARDLEGKKSDINGDIRMCQEDDVLDAMLREHTISEDDIEEYIEHVYCWGTDEDTVEPDDLLMRVFEMEHLGRFGDSHYDLNTKSGVSQEVEDFRRDTIISGVSNYIYNERGDNFQVDIDEVPISKFPELEELVEGHSWKDVAREFEDLDPMAWTDPLEGTETAKVKEQTIENMVDMFTYSEESARRTSDAVMADVAHLSVWKDDPEEAITPAGGGV